VVRSRTEAAAELIRLEHERDRLTQALASLEPRREAAHERLRQIDERAQLLLGFLGLAGADDTTQAGAAILRTRQPQHSKGSET
jgi:Flp pilus assembly protein TadB